MQVLTGKNEAVAYLVMAWMLHLLISKYQNMNSCIYQELSSYM